MKQYDIDKELHKEVERLGAKDIELCMQCGICAASCPLSDDVNSFPRKIYRYLQLGLKDKLLASPEPWLCYYCGDCNIDCPRGAEPAETMMAVRRWLITQCDWTGLAAKFYASSKWQIGGFLAVMFSVILLFLFTHGPVITDRVALNSFAPVHWVHIADLTLVAVLALLLFSNGLRMYSAVMQGSQFTLQQHIRQIPVFLLHYVTQKKWRKCESNSKLRLKPVKSWLRHIILFSGYVIMEILVIGYIEVFQTDIVHPLWHPTRIFGYYAAVALLVVSGNILYSRWYIKEEKNHRYSDFTDSFFLVLLFVIAFTGLMVHFFRLAGWPIATYSMYVLHVAICVGMLCIMLPYGKLSHLFYRPLAIFLTTIKKKAAKVSDFTAESLKEDIDETFMACMQCGICTTVCPVNNVSSYSPRQILRSISIDAATVEEVDLNVWNCLTCNSCVANCPRGIEIVHVTKAIREKNICLGQIPNYLQQPLHSLNKHNNPWNGGIGERSAWAGDDVLPAFTRKTQYCLFTCCTIAYDDTASQGNTNAGRTLNQLLKTAGVSVGTLGVGESCCGDLAHRTGDTASFAQLAEKNKELFTQAGVEKLVTTSPHCLTAFKKHYSDLSDIQIRHYTELLWRLIKEGTIRPVKELRTIVTYHDPCYLGRYNEVYDAPRQILGRIPGVKLVEMPHNREQSLCCGGGGGGAFKPQTAEHLGRVRIQEAIDTGAEVIAVACPYCLKILNEAVRDMDSEKKIRVCDVAELLAQSVEPSEK
ncbi:MAG: 4Fe-4S dicluster domain-containing protein [Candidatus Electrothrix sp. AR4]|nr:4Fe-4S dicluster domain-containing protein [Candidatus Electrothrix sp. AR4]